MCIGLMYCNNDNEEQPLFSLTEEPWSLLPKNTCALRIRNTSMRLHGMPICLALSQYLVHWTRNQILEWLNHNPIRDVVDIEVLTNEVLRLRDLLIRAQRQQGIDIRTTASGGQGGQRNWRGVLLYLCVIMSLTQAGRRQMSLSCQG